MAGEDQRPAEPPAPAFNLDEIQILKQARLFQDLVAQEGWKVFSAMLDIHMRERERVLQLPMSALPADWKEMDYQTRQAQLESVKGALIGLRLARDLPSLTIQHAQEIVSEHKRGED